MQCDYSSNRGDCVACPATGFLQWKCQDLSQLLGEQVKTHQNNFQKTVRVLQANESDIVRNVSAAREMAQFINALDRENKKRPRGSEA